MRISDWSSDVCSSDLELKNLLEPADFGDPSVIRDAGRQGMLGKRGYELVSRHAPLAGCLIPVEAKASDLPDIRPCGDGPVAEKGIQVAEQMRAVGWQQPRGCAVATPFVGQNQIMGRRGNERSEEHTSELQSLMSN